MKRGQIEEKARDFCKKDVYGCNECCDECVQEIEKQKMIDLANWALSNQWMSVEDELPKDQQNVFIRLVSGRSTSGWYSQSRDEWFISVGEIDGYNLLYEHVTHWMPIPPLAEEGGEK